MKRFVGDFARVIYRSTDDIGYEDIKGKHLGLEEGKFSATVDEVVLTYPKKLGKRYATKVLLDYVTELITVEIGVSSKELSDVKAVRRSLETK